MTVREIDDANRDAVLARDELFTSAMSATRSPIPCYERYRFVRTGLAFDDEFVLRLGLAGR